MSLTPIIPCDKQFNEDIVPEDWSPETTSSSPPQSNPKDPLTDIAIDTFIEADSKKPLNLSAMYQRRPQNRYLPPTSFQPFIGFSRNWTSIGGIPDGIHASIPEITNSGTYESKISGLTTAYNENPEVILGFEYRNWDRTSKSNPVYRQIGPTLGVRTQIGKYNVTNYSYTAVLDPNSIEAQLLSSGGEIAAAIGASDYGSLQSIVSQMFNGIDVDDTVYGNDNSNDKDALRWQFDGRIGAGNAVYHARAPVGVFEHFDIGATSSMSVLDKDFFLGIGMYSDVGILRLGHSPKVELLAEGLLRYHTAPSSSDSYMVEAGVGFNVRTSVDLRKKK